MKLENKDKISRILDMYTELINGHVVEKTKIAQAYEVNERSIERDINDIRDFMNRRENMPDTIVFDKNLKGYRMERLCITGDLPDVVDKMSKIGQAIRQCRYLKIEYQRSEERRMTEKVKPIAILFSGKIFYMAAFRDGSEDLAEGAAAYPIMYSIPFLAEVQMQEELFRIPYGCKFEEGDFKQQIPFLYGGKLRFVRFRCSGALKEEAMNRFPTAEVFSEEGELYEVSVEVLGGEFDMWMKSHEEEIEIII